MSTPYRSGAIFTDEKGVPVERPERPGEDGTVDDEITFVRAVRAYNDYVTDMANSSFAEAFREALKR